MSPEGIRSECRRLHSMLDDGDSICGKVPYGVDLLLPQVGGKARKTNKDYTGGQLEAMVRATSTPLSLVSHITGALRSPLPPRPLKVDVMIEEKVPLFVCAVGIPPLWVVEKLHAAGIVVMNMAGAPRHVTKALEVGVDIICASGTEGGALVLPRLPPPALSPRLLLPVRFLCVSAVSVSIDGCWMLRLFWHIISLLFLLVIIIVVIIMSSSSSSSSSSSPSPSSFSSSSSSSSSSSP